ncbi:MAG: extracellular solute-binding protein [Halobacteriaceae archaeon]
MRDHRSAGGPSRRAFLAGLAGASAGLAGCIGTDGGDGSTTAPPRTTAVPDIIGSSPAGRPLPGGTPMAAMPDLEGSLTVYSGRGEFLVGQLMQHIREEYPEFQLDVRYGGASDLTNQIRVEGQATPADVFFTVNAPSNLGLLATQGRLRSLPEAVTSLGRAQYQDPQGRWVGTSGRVRTVPYNTNRFAASDVPEDVMAFPDLDRFQGEMGWAPTYDSFQGFVTVMRILEGEQATREWLQGMLDLGVREYPDEFTVARRVADGELGAGLTNHYYILRVLAGNPSAPLAMGFTENDAGSFFNVAGAGVVDATDTPDVAANFVRHLLSAEAQDYFARTATYEYPMIPEVEPIDRLPAFAELNPPSVDVTDLAAADTTATVDLLEDVGVL